jgi:hypothetical protein
LADCAGLACIDRVVVVAVAATRVVPRATDAMGRSGRRHNRVAGAMLKSLSGSGNIGNEGWCIGYAHRKIGYIGMLKGPLVVDHDSGTFSSRNIF